MKHVLLVVLWFVAVLVAGPSRSIAQNLRSPSMNLEFHRAQAAWKSGGSLLEAKARLDRVIEAGPDDTEALVLRARVELAMKHYADALRDAQHAAELRPDHGDAQFVLVQAARLAGDTTTALAALERSLALVESDPVKHIVLSREALLLGEHETCESLARVAVALDGTNAEAHYQLARALAVQGKMEAAVLLVSRGLEDGLLTVDYVREDPVLDSTGVARAALSRD
jgi:tetratricopeptide (TPR) repeat protein